MQPATGAALWIPLLCFVAVPNCRAQQGSEAPGTLNPSVISEGRARQLLKELPDPGIFVHSSAPSWPPPDQHLTSYTEGAGVWLDLWARILLAYQMGVIKGEVSLVDIYVAANAAVRFHPAPTVLYGEVRGHLEVLRLFSFNLKENFSLNL